MVVEDHLFHAATEARQIGRKVGFVETPRASDEEAVVRVEVVSRPRHGEEGVGVPVHGQSDVALLLVDLYRVPGQVVELSASLGVQQSLPGPQVQFDLRRNILNQSSRQGCNNSKTIKNYLL